MTVALEDLVVEELSLVDAPANLREGYLAQKSLRLPTLTIVAKDKKHRIVSAVGYEPGVDDGHGEQVDALTLSTAFLGYAARADKTLHAQHDTNTNAGEVIALSSWPVARKSKLCTPDGCATPTLKAYTVYVIAKLTPEAFKTAENGSALGFSLGGKAKRTNGTTKDTSDQLESGWLWTSDARVAKVATAAELRLVHDELPLWDMPRDTDAKTLDGLGGAVLELGFLEVPA